MIRLLSIFFVAAALVFTLGHAQAQTFSWQATAGEPNTHSPTDSVISIAIDANGDIFASVERNDGLYVGSPVGVYRSADGGATWDSLPNPLNDQKGIVPLGPVYGCSPNGYVFMGGGKGLYRVNDNGTGVVPDTITQGTNPTIAAMAFAPNGKIIVATSEMGLC